MKQQISDEQLDRMMRSLICDAAPQEEELKDIADSPNVWWAVQRQINVQKDTARSPWPPVKTLRRWLLIAVPTAAAATVIISLFVFKSVPTLDQARTPESVVPVAASSDPLTPAPVPAAPNVEAVDSPATKAISAKKEARPVRPLKGVLRDGKEVPSTLTAASEDTDEFKTDFISLTYAKNPESGQIVRVKVPSSMMVSLGLVASVEKPANLVDAEVLVGDDGLTHAIRFIR